MGIREELSGKLSEKELAELKTSFDVVGDIAILEMPKSLEKKGKVIAEAVVKVNPNIKTVLSKAGGREGRLRLRKHKLILGKSAETIHIEHGCRFKVDVNKVYFSPREATERKRIAELVKPKERVLVMFSGAGPFGVVIGKACPTCKVIQVELNKDGVKYGDENVMLNQLKYQVENIQGDVRKVCPDLGEFDRILMPLPESAWEFLPTAFKCIKKGGTIHLYGISEEATLFKDLEEKLMGQAKKEKAKIKVLNRRKVLPFGSRVWKVCIDFKVVI